MDPLSIVASSIAIAHTINRALEFVERTNKAGAELNALHNEISDLTVVLGELEILLRKRAASGYPYLPNANLTKSIHLTKTRLGTIAEQVKCWKEAIHDRKDGIDQYLLKVLRVSHKAKKFKDELIAIKHHLTSTFSILSVSSSSRVEVDLKQILLLSEKNRIAQEQLKSDMVEYFSRDASRILSSSATLQPGDDPTVESSLAHSGPNICERGLVRAFHANGPVLFPSSQMTAVSAVGIRVAQFSRIPCNPWCSCICHRETQSKTPSFLSQVLGTLFIGYSGLPLFVGPCDQKSCHLRAQPFASVTYVFPSWFLARAVSLVMTTTPLAGPTVSLKVQRTVPGDAAIFKYAKQGDALGMRQLFENGLASPFDVQFDSGVTAMHYAVNYQHLEVCTLLLQCNADPFIEDYTGVAPVDNAWGKILSRNLSASKERDLRLMFSETESIERREFSVLHKIVTGLVPKDLQQELSASTADINLPDSNGRTPLSFAAQRGDAEAVAILLQFGADVSKASVCGNAPLHHAVTAQGPGCIELLLSYQADINITTGWGQTPLHFLAAFKDDADRALLLLEHGADFEIRDRDGMTALDWSAISGNTAVAQVLLAHGANIANKDNYGNTVLVHAISGNRHSILEHLTSGSMCRILKDSLDQALMATVVETAAKFADLTTITILTSSRLRFHETGLNTSETRCNLLSVLDRRGDASEDLRLGLCTLISDDYISDMEEYEISLSDSTDDAAVGVSSSVDEGNFDVCWQDAMEYLDST